jgi:hypothetical protein
MLLAELLLDNPESKAVETIVHDRAPTVSQRLTFFSFSLSLSFGQW